MKLCEEAHSFLKLFSKPYPKYQEEEQKFSPMPVASPEGSWILTHHSLALIAIFGSH